MTTDTSGVTPLKEILSMIDLGPTSSVQMAYAKLMLAQSMICKNSAEQKMDQIEQIQEEQSKVAEFLSQARVLQEEAETDKKGTVMPDDMAKFFTDNKLAYDTTNKDYAHDKDQWNVAIQSLTNYQESISNQTQTLMVYLQDFISQYNSYLQGANSAVQEASNVLTSIATGR